MRNKVSYITLGDTKTTVYFVSLFGAGESKKTKRETEFHSVIH